MKTPGLVRRFCLCLALLAVVFCSGFNGMAADLFVNLQAGNDAKSGSRSQPLATIQKAIGMSRPGDAISLLPGKSIYRQHFVLSGRRDLTIEENSVTLADCRNLVGKKWGDKLFRRRFPRTTWEPHFRIIKDARKECGEFRAVILQTFQNRASYQQGSSVLIRSMIRPAGSTCEDQRVRINGARLKSSTVRLRTRQLILRGQP